MARMTPKEIGEALELENDIQHDLDFDQEEREAWYDYQSELDSPDCDLYNDYDPHEYDHYDDYDPYPEPDWFLDCVEW